MSETRRVKRWYGWAIEPASEPAPPKPGPKPSKPQPAKRTKKPCSDCTSPAYARGWCRRHYEQHRGTDEWDRRIATQQPQHGTRTRYDKGCRCDACRQRESEYRAAWRLRTGNGKTSRVLGGQS